MFICHGHETFFRDFRKQQFSVEEAVKLIQQERQITVISGIPRIVRRKQNIVQAVERGIVGQGFFIEHIQNRSDFSGMKRGEQRVLITQPGTSAVDEYGF